MKTGTIGKTVHAYDYTDLMSKNLEGVRAVVWTHPDIPFYASTVVLNEDGTYTTGRSLSQDQVTVLVRGG